MRATPPEIEADDDTGTRLRRELSHKLESSRKTFSASGIHLGYRYGQSPICVPDGTPEPPDDPQIYHPSTWPGTRAPHAWRAPGVSTLDWFGRGFTLLALGGELPDLTPFEGEAHRSGLPLDVVRCEIPEVCTLYQRKLVLVRPDGHVAWRADAVPDDVRRILDVVRGAAPA